MYKVKLMNKISSVGLDYFNEDYEKAVADIESKGKTYKDSIDLIPDIDFY